LFILKTAHYHFHIIESLVEGLSFVTHYSSNNEVRLYCPG